MLKRAIQGTLNSLGYEIRRKIKPPPEVAPAPDDKNPFLTFGPPYGATKEQSFLVTESLYAKVPAQALDAFNEFAAQNPDVYSYLEHAPPEALRREVLRLGNYHLPELFNAATGLSRFNPPENVHAMVRQQEYCGDMYYCDMVTETLARAGLGIKPGGRYLDFGCSSGRVVRTLSAEFSGSHFYGCDPNADAIAWASSAMPQSTFFVSPERPPLPLEDHLLDGAYAISIWSHFSARAAKYWFDEMARVLRPGGFLMFTTHGVGSVEHYMTEAGMAESQGIEVRADLDRTGHHFIDVFGTDGDWGVGKSDWGQAFMTPYFVLQHLQPHWSLLDFIGRRSESNQDVYLLQRKA